MNSNYRSIDELDESLQKHIDSAEVALQSNMAALETLRQAKKRITQAVTLSLKRPPFRRFNAVAHFDEIATLYLNVANLLYQTASTVGSAAPSEARQHLLSARADVLELRTLYRNMMGPANNNSVASNSDNNAESNNNLMFSFNNIPSTPSKKGKAKRATRRKAMSRKTRKSQRSRRN